MAGYFSLGENKIRPGAYFNVQKRGDETNFGAIDGVVAVLFKSSIGPLGKATVLPASEGYENTFGTGGTTDALRELHSTEALGMSALTTEVVFSEFATTTIPLALRCVCRQGIITKKRSRTLLRSARC